MLLINWENNLELNLSEKCVLVGGTAANPVPELKITGTLGYLLILGFFSTPSPYFVNTP